MYKAKLLVIDSVNVENETQLEELLNQYEETTGTDFDYGAESLLEKLGDDTVKLTSHNGHEIVYGVVPEPRDKLSNHYVNKVVDDAQDTDANALYLYSMKFFGTRMRTVTGALPKLVQEYDVVYFTRENIVSRDASTAQIKDAHHRGRPPLGFTMSDEGRLTKDSNYERVRHVLSRVLDDDDSLSKRKAAEKLGVTRKTINNLLERSGRYNL